jgi:predicted ester cyclase
MPETNKRLALRWLEAIWNGDLNAPAAGVVEQVVHPDFHNHEAAADRPGGTDGFRDTARRLRRAFADLRIEPLDVIAEADKIVIRARVSGRQVGPFLLACRRLGASSRSSTPTPCGSRTGRSSSTGPTATTTARCASSGYCASAVTRRRREEQEDAPAITAASGRMIADPVAMAAGAP